MNKKQIIAEINRAHIDLESQCNQIAGIFRYRHYKSKASLIVMYQSLMKHAPELLLTSSDQRI
jgi:hypothetical protein